VFAEPTVSNPLSSAFLLGGRKDVSEIHPFPINGGNGTRTTVIAHYTANIHYSKSVCVSEQVKIVATADSVILCPCVN
jgi:hypothetical protein